MSNAASIPGIDRGQPCAKEPRSTKLLVHPRPKLDESAGGYLVRLAHENKLTETAGILKLLGLRLKTAMGLGVDGIYHVAAGIPRQEIAALPRLIDPAAGSFTQTWYRTRICPHCLSAYGYRRIAWDQHMAVSCPEHDVRLIEHCDRCGFPVVYGMGSLYKCRCGRDLRLIPTGPTPPWLSDFYAKFAPWRVQAFLQPNCVSCNVNDRPAAQLVRSVINLARQSMPPHLRGDLKRDIWFTPEEWQIVGELISGWPIAFRQVVGRAFGAMDPTNRRTLVNRVRRANLPEILAVMGPVSRTLDEMLDEKKFRRRLTLTPPADDLMPLSEFVRAVKIHEKRARQLFESGMLSRATVSVERRTRYWIGVEELRAVQRWRATTLSVEEAAQFMKCGSDHIRALIRTGHLPCVDFVYFPRATRLYASALSEFLDGLRRRSIALPPGVTAIARLTDIPVGTHQSDMRRRWCLFMEALRSRQIPLFDLGDPAASLSDLAVRRIDILRFIRVRKMHPM